MDAAKGIETAPTKKHAVVTEKKMKQIIALLNTKEKSSAIQKELLPVLTQSGDHLVNFFHEQKIKDKDMFKLCQSVKYNHFCEGQFASYAGENGIQSRQMNIMLDGTISVLMPLPPDLMLTYV